MVVTAAPTNLLVAVKHKLNVRHIRETQQHLQWILLRTVMCYHNNAAVRRGTSNPIEMYQLTQVHVTTSNEQRGRFRQLRVHGNNY